MIPRPDDAVARTTGSGPRLFLDSADPADWKRLLGWGIFHGVTTNPLLLERAGQTCSVAHLKELARQIHDLGCHEIQVQTWGSSADQMVETGRRLAEITEPGFRAVIKIPATPEGFKAARTLTEDGHPTTLTAVYTPGQVLAAAGMGAHYAAPYLGRLDDAGHDGRNILLTMHRILAGTGSKTRLLAASLRTAAQIVDLAAAGLDTFTFGAPVADELLASDLTAAAAGDFQRAAEAMKEKS